LSMSEFSATTENEAVVPADRMAIWAALTDPKLLPELTPLLSKIETQGEVWTWHMTRISALGVGVTPSFTERMTFEDGRRIEYTHEPPAGVTERAGAEGIYELSDVEGGTLLKIKLTLHVELPLPRRVGPAVSRVMKSTMARTGDKFSANLLRHLGVDEASQAARV
jgi:carbon monoxide dehydrogenase subunit G